MSWSYSNYFTQFLRHSHRKQPNQTNPKPHVSPYKSVFSVFHLPHWLYLRHGRNPSVSLSLYEDEGGARKGQVYKPTKIPRTKKPIFQNQSTYSSPILYFPSLATQFSPKSTTLNGPFGGWWLQGTGAFVQYIYCAGTTSSRAPVAYWSQTKNHGTASGQEIVLIFYLERTRSISPCLQ